jgi:general nucleoside transport system permease protein
MGFMSTAAATRETVGEVSVRDRADVRRQIRLLVVFGLVALLCLVFWLTTDDAHIQYALGERISAENPAKSLNGEPLLIAALLLSVIAVALAAVLARRSRVRRRGAGVPHELPDLELRRPDR